MIWYPYEQMKTMKAPYKIIDANGVYIYTEENQMIDSVSSWWSVIHGYKHPELTKALTMQAEKFSHIMLGGLTHKPVQMLSEKLQSWLPGDLDYCFFSDIYARIYFVPYALSPNKLLPSISILLIKSTA